MIVAHQKPAEVRGEVHHTAHGSDIHRAASPKTGLSSRVPAQPSARVAPADPEAPDQQVAYRLPCLGPANDTVIVALSVFSTEIGEGTCPL